MKITIEKMGKKPIVTKRGPAVNVGIFSQGVWYSAIESDWTKNWKVGDTIEADVKQNGKYYNLYPPRRDSSVDEIKGLLAQIMTEILALKAMMSFPAKHEPPPHKDGDFRPGDSGEESEELPF